MSLMDNNVRTKYAKIPLKDKLCFLKMVKEEHMSIKEVKKYLISECCHAWNQLFHRKNTHKTVPVQHVPL